METQLAKDQQLHSNSKEDSVSGTLNPKSARGTFPFLIHAKRTCFETEGGTADLTPKGPTALHTVEKETG